ncbi:MAG TPA: FkbM family methyltransferase [Gaiellaceae bacterium]|nr:FkbM family methyltransferase [Gaiellaceae bacterium]
MAPDGLKRTRLARTVATRLLGRGPRVVEIVGGVARGGRMELELGVEKAFWIGVFEPEVQAVLRELVEPGEVAFDVGAYIGFYSLALARLGAGPVVAVEPVPENAARVRRMAELNGGHIVTVEAVAAAASGRRTLELGPTAAMSRLAGTVGVTWGPDEPVRRIEVDAVRLDDLARLHGVPRLIKVDVEGAAAEVLGGAAETLESRPTILCEMHGTDEREDVERLLRARGYTIEPATADHVVARHPAQ